MTALATVSAAGTALAGAFGSNPWWYLTRATGVVSFLLLTMAFVLGLASTRRALASPAWPRFATQHLHRNVSLLGVGLLVAHVVTTLVDSYVSISWWAWVVPGASAYRTPWVALGTLAFDLLLVVVATSLVRDRMSNRAWRAVHWAAYALWPLTFLHFLTTGTDAFHGRWGLWLALVSLVVVAAAAGARWWTRDTPAGPVRSMTRSAR